jgi:hypothetical protein
MATTDFERDPRPEEEQDPFQSDLIGVKLTLLLGAGFLAVLAAFFLIGPVVGMLVLIAAVVAAILAVVKVIRRAEEPPA